MSEISPLEPSPGTSSSNRTLWIILGVVALFLCCCCLALFAAGGFFLNMASQANLDQNPTPAVRITLVIGTPTPRTPRLTATPSTRATAAVTPDATPLETTPRPPISDSGAGSETERLLREVNVPQRDLRTLSMQLRPGIGEIPPTVNPTPPSFKVGDVITFTVSNVDDNRHFEIEAELRYQTPHLYMWVEKGQRVNQAALKRSADLFETSTYPTNREFFGSEWTPGVDNDVHLHILHATNLGNSIAGYYSSADEFSRLAQPFSNEKEMFYINLDNNEPGTDFYDGTLAHEFQHMIHWHNDRNEETWVNEGSSELASALNKFDPGGSDAAFMSNPDTQLNTWGSQPGANAPHYGGAYLFMTYFLEQFGEEMTRALVASSLNGIAGFNDVLAKNNTGTNFDAVFADWVIANLLSGDNPQDARFAYKTIDPGSVTQEATFRRYPAIEEGGTVLQYATDYFALKGSGDVTIDFTGNTQVGLVDAQAHSGAFAWWGNRTDDSDATLTHDFDLKGVKNASLNFWTWYDLEEDFDYAYVEVSTDAGKTWTILPGRYSVTTNPNGNSFGPAFTGVSGGGRAPEWVQESIDLSAYAGQQVQVRFQYITDDAVNGPGILLDDISIPELNYSSDVEGADGGWVSQGWLRTDNILAQRWLVQVVEQDRQGVKVSVIEVGPDGKGSLDVSAIGNNGKVAYLAVSAIAPVTTETATYSFEIRKR